MPGSSFGRLFRITTFGESHGPAVGVIVDGVPAGLPLTKEDVEFELSFRRPGRLFVSGRREKDEPEILSGIFNGRTTGSPIAIMVRNNDIISSLYEEVKLSHVQATLTFLSYSSTAMRTGTTGEEVGPVLGKL